MNGQDRGDWTSASAAEYDNLCPGRFQAQRGLPEQTNPDAESGTRIHAWLALQDDPQAGKPDLTDDEQETADACAELEDQILAKWNPEGNALKVFRERRFWIEFDLWKHSGQADIVFYRPDDNTALILDYKTGRNEVAESAYNLQLRDLAVLVYIELGANLITVAPVQPWASRTPQLCEYRFADLLRSYQEMCERIKRSHDPAAGRLPGESQCKYCRAAGNPQRCPESCESLSSLAMVPPEPTTRELMLNPGMVSDLLIKCDMAEAVISKIKTHAKQMLSEGVNIPGWKLKPGSVRESIKDPQKCWNRAQAKGVTVEQFMGAVTVKKGELKTALKAATGTKGKGLDAEMEALLAGITEEKQSAPSLERVKDE